MMTPFHGKITIWNTGFSLSWDDHILQLCKTLGLYSLSDETSYQQISYSVKAARLDVIIIISL